LFISYCYWIIFIDKNSKSNKCKYELYKKEKDGKLVYPPIQISDSCNFYNLIKTYELIKQEEIKEGE
jgi:abortive infection bacteriophage resistance protein